MGTMTHIAGRAAFSKAVDIVLKNADKDREKEITKLVDLMEKYMGSEKIDVDYNKVKELICDKDKTLNKYINRLLDEINPHVLKTTALNLGYEAFFHGTKTIRKMREVHDCNVPWLILMDPTSACNLHCTGCWAAEYGNKLNLTFDEMDSVITQGKELGIYLYMFTGGEPLVRKEDIIKLPKVELHCHLDGSLSQGFVEKRLGRPVGKEELSVSDDCTSLAEYLEKFDLPGQCLRDEEGLEEAGYDVLRSMKQENVIYSEIRFAPLLSETEDMNCNKVIEAVLKGLERGKKDFGIEFGLIVCAMRHHSEEMNWRMIRTAREYLGSGVCAADLAGAEAIYPMSEFKNLFQNTYKIGMPFTIHAGECGSAQNIIDSVEAGAGRIGHGIAMRGHGDLIKELAGKGIGIEMCPISNLQTKAVAGPEEYPIREFLDGGLKVTVNTDNRTVSDTTMTKELEFIQKTYGIRDDEILCLMKNAADVAFATDSVKDKLYRMMGEAYGA